MAKKSIAKNYIYNTIYQVLIIILPIITTPYLSRVLGAGNIGIFSYTVSISAYFIMFGSLGVALYGQREIAYKQDNLRERSKIFYEIVIFRAITMALSALVFYFSFVYNSNTYNLYFTILLLELLANVLDISWFFQGLEEFKKTALRNIAVKIISVVCIFIFVKGPNDLYKYFIIYTLSMLVGNISLWLYLPKFVCKIKIKTLKVVRHLKPTFALFIPQVAIQVYTILDKTMLGYISKDMNEVGNYEQSQSMVKIILTLVTSLCTVMAPRIASLIAKKDKEAIRDCLRNSFKFVWLLGVPLMFGLMGCAKNFIPWFLGDGFEKSISLVQVGSILIIAIGLNSITGMQYLIPAKKESLFTMTVVSGAVLNFAMNSLLIPKYKAMGAIIASVSAEIIVLILQLYVTRKDIKLKDAFSDSYKYLICGAIMFGVVLVVSQFFSGVIGTVIQVVLGGITYVGALLIIRDKFTYELIDKYLKKYIKKKA